jgi:hypothetical protein
VTGIRHDRQLATFEGTERSDAIFCSAEVIAVADEDHRRDGDRTQVAEPVAERAREAAEGKP